MRRRTLLALPAAIGLLGALKSAVASSTPRLVFASAANIAVAGAWIGTLKSELRRLGYEEGRNISFDERFADFKPEDMDRMAADVIASKPAVIVAQGRTIISFAKLTKSVPMIVASSGDMVESGLVKTMARPGGNVSGVQLLYFELVGKRLEVLKEILPRLERVAVIASPYHAGVERERMETEAAAQRLGLRITYHPVKGESEVDGGLEAIRASGAQAIVSFPDGVTFPLRAQIARFAQRHGMATVSSWDGYADAGHLVIYGPNLRATYAQLARQVDKVLRGASPATLPAEYPDTFELVVNLKTAKVLGVTVPQAVLLRADRVIE